MNLNIFGNIVMGVLWDFEALGVPAGRFAWRWANYMS